MDILPTDTTLARYTFEVTLANTNFKFGFEWNERAQFWTMDVMLPDGTPLAMGVKVCLGTSLIGRYKDARLPAGDIACLDTSGQRIEPGFSDLGNRVLVMFIPNAEIVAGA